MFAFQGVSQIPASLAPRTTSRPCRRCQSATAAIEAATSASFSWWDRVSLTEPPALRSPHGYVSLEADDEPAVRPTGRDLGVSPVLGAGVARMVARSPLMAIRGL
jgi:hypothetical protein